MKSAASLRDKLLAKSKDEKLIFQQLLYRFFHERFLARLVASRHTEFLILKGGNLIYAWKGNTARPTIDIDFLGKNISNESEHLESVVKEICQIQLNDFVNFDITTIETAQINQVKTYHGTRFKFDTTFDTIRQKIQLDIGFGDTITPEPILLNYPVLLTDFHDFNIKAYNPETVIAEKIHAIFILAGFNSRLKDFYDIYELVLANSFNNLQLKNAILNTFSTRKTEYNNQLMNDILLEIGNDQSKVNLWKSFLKKINSENIEFNVVLKIITNTLNNSFTTI
jgi:hypothetical protein